MDRIYIYIYIYPVYRTYHLYIYSVYTPYICIYIYIYTYTYRTSAVWICTVYTVHVYMFVVRISTVYISRRCCTRTPRSRVHEGVPNHGPHSDEACLVKQGPARSDMFCLMQTPRRPCHKIPFPPLPRPPSPTRPAFDPTSPHPHPPQPVPPSPPTPHPQPHPTQPYPSSLTLLLRSSCHDVSPTSPRLGSLGAPFANGANTKARGCTPLPR
jgi:hypothetical protein